MKKTTTIAILATLILLSGVNASATNMGFRFHKGICPIAFPAPKGENWVSFPYNSPYTNAQDLCLALNLTPGTGKILQYDPSAPLAPLSHNCGGLGAFTLLTGFGVIATNPTATSGILAGSHPSTPPPFPAGFKLYPLGIFPQGFNMYLLPYNSDAVTAQDLCLQLALPVGASVLRRDACTGTTSSHNCGAAGPFRLVLGEAVVIRFPGGAPIIGINPPHI